ncbi:DsbA family protein [Chitinophaga sp. HK235]|uniref:DsbA family protein n=1 Tax=Chitinophaga sp. HK235 TaxID=2952571 RepID=UPI001BA82F53|nr:DsbA family protein [Chitinophaga sp. HK235]
METKLIYVMDPLCGWCYGSADNLLKLTQQYAGRLAVEIIPAGMWAGVNVRTQSRAMAQYFIRHDRQIEALTGTAFGTDYFAFLGKEVVLDSEVPSRAIMAVQQLAPEKAVVFMVKVQQARYQHGKDLNDTQVYLNICQELGIDTGVFQERFTSASLQVLTLHAFEKATSYASAYPSLFIEHNGRRILLEQGYASYAELDESVASIVN